jgi:hypothetical protein
MKKGVIILLIFIIIILLFLILFNKKISENTVYDDFPINNYWEKNGILVMIFNDCDSGECYVGVVPKSKSNGYGKEIGVTSTGEPLIEIWSFDNRDSNHIILYDYRYKKKTKRIIKLDEKHLFIYDLNYKLIETWNGIPSQNVHDYHG